jgi:hypothetical protein
MYEITSYSGYYYVTCLKTGKLLIETSFRYYEDAVKAAKTLTT